jgi:hypothetical protein
MLFLPYFDGSLTGSIACNIIAGAPTALFSWQLWLSQSQYI